MAGATTDQALGEFGYSTIVHGCRFVLTLTSAAGTFRQKFAQVIEGMGELHLEIICDRMMREFNVECEIGAPQVAYREAISKPATVESRARGECACASTLASMRLEHACSL